MDNSLKKGRTPSTTELKEMHVLPLFSTPGQPRSWTLPFTQRRTKPVNRSVPCVLVAMATHVATHGHRHGNPWLPWLPWRQMISFDTEMVCPFFSTGDLLIQALHQWIYIMGKPAKTTRNHMGKTTI
jgi:hypothetical protein